jgi:putative hydrolase of the HAD superfamily
MNHIKAIGFDLFNTLMTVEPRILQEAVLRLIRDLRQSGIAIEEAPFIEVYRKSALEHLEEARKTGRETHNRFWVSGALQALGFDVPPEDARIAGAIESYFSAFYPSCRLIPGTAEMLRTLNGKYRLGLLSNFTHGPAARKILEVLGLDACFEVILISGELGFRKPHPFVFRRLIDHLGVEPNRTLFVGDDPEPDIKGAQQAEIHPVWTTYVRDHKMPTIPGVPAADSWEPADEVARISTWDDLYALLKT